MRYLLLLLLFPCVLFAQNQGVMVNSSTKVISSPTNIYDPNPGFFNITNVMFVVDGDSNSVTNDFDPAIGTNWLLTWPGKVYGTFGKWKNLPNTNYAQSGRLFSQMNSEWTTKPGTVMPNQTNMFLTTVSAIYGGFNDIRSGAAATAVFATGSNIWYQTHLQGGISVAFTIHQSTGIAFQAAQEVERISYNNMLRLNRQYYDYLIDLDTLLTNSVANEMRADFTVDGIHFNPVCNQVIATNFYRTVMFPLLAGRKGAHMRGTLKVQPNNDAFGNSAVSTLFEVAAGNNTRNAQYSYNGVQVSDVSTYFMQAGGGNVAVNFSPLFTPPASRFYVGGAYASVFNNPSLTLGNYTSDALFQDSIVGIPNGTLRTNTLFSAPSYQGRFYYVYDAGGTASGTNITVKPPPSSGQLISGAAEVLIDRDFGGLLIWSDGVNFHRLDPEPRTLQTFHSIGIDNILPGVTPLTYIKGGLNSVTATNLLGVNHYQATSPKSLNFNTVHEYIQTNRLSGNQSLILTNSSDGQSMGGIILGEVSGGTSRVITFIPHLGQLIEEVGDYTTGLATSLAVTVTNGLSMEWSVKVRRVNGTNIHHFARAYYKH